MPEPQQLNKLLKGKTIISIEPGITPGWMIINLEPQGMIRNCEALKVIQGEGSFSAAPAWIILNGELVTHGIE